MLSQLQALNKYWLYTDYDHPELHTAATLPTDVVLIQMHLSHVERHLRALQHDLTPEQLQNRLRSLDTLNAYGKRGVFPINLYHENRTPYFIDDFGTACAVGQLIISSGYQDLAQKISKNHNYSYLKNINDPEIMQWAEKHGFTMEELKWIQPTYSGCSQFSSHCFDGNIHDAICYNTPTGCYAADPPTQLPSPPYTYQNFKFDTLLQSWVSISYRCQLYAGNYKIIITNSVGDSEDFFFTIGQPDSIEIIVTQTNASDPCDGSFELQVLTSYPPFHVTSYHSPLNTTIHDNLCAGLYSGYVTDSKGCKAAYNVWIEDVNGGTGTSCLPGEKRDLSCYQANDGCFDPFPPLPPGVVIPFYPNINITYQWQKKVGNQWLAVSQPCNLPVGEYRVSLRVTPSYPVGGVFNNVYLYSHIITEPDPFTLQLTTSADSGNCNGSARVIVNGGKPPYQYQWSQSNNTSDSIHHLCHDFYSVTITDSEGCSASYDFLIERINPCPNSICAYFGINHLSCFDDNDGCFNPFPNSTLTNPPFVYQWFALDTLLNQWNTIHSTCNLPAGTYKTTVRNRSNQTEDIFSVILKPDTLSVTILTTSDEFTCNGSAIAQVSGGKPPYTYIWSTGDITERIQGLCHDLYSITVKDANECQTIAKNFAILPTPVCHVSACHVGVNHSFHAKDISCFGLADGCFNYMPASILPDSFLRYRWFKLDEQRNVWLSLQNPCGLTAGFYKCVISGSGSAFEEFSFVVHEPDGISLEVNASDDHGNCSSNMEVQISGGIPPYQVSWSNSTTQGTFLEGLCHDLYTITVMDDNRCLKTYELSIDLVSGLSDIADLDYQMYPNPTQNKIFVVLNEPFTEIVTATVYNAHGQSVFESQFDRSSFYIALELFSDGLYILKLCNGKKTVQNKFVKNSF